MPKTPKSKSQADEDGQTPRLDRIERALVAVGDAAGVHSPPLDEIRADVDNMPDESGHTPRMLRQYDEMVSGMISRGDIDPDTGAVVTRERAVEMANAYLTDIQEGRRDENGTLVT